MISAFLALLTLALLLSSLVLTIVAIVNKFRRNAAYRRQFVFAGGSFVLSFVAIVILGIMSPPASKNSASPRLVTKRNPVHKHETDFPMYLDLHVGQHAILDDNAEGKQRATLFDDLQTVHKWAQGNANPAELPHHDLPVRTPVTVLSWTRVKSLTRSDYLMIKVATLKGQMISGYSRDISTLPDIPIGATLVVHSIAGNSAGVRLNQGDEKQAFQIVDGTRVAALAVHPDGQSISPYRARVLDGKHRGANLWFDMFSLGAPSPKISSEEYNDVCKCVSLYLIDRKYAQAHPPTPSPTATPDPGPLTDEDKAYMNEACNLMYVNGSGYGFDFGDGGDPHNNLRIVTCADDADQLMYFRKEHLAELKTRYVKDGQPSGTPGGFKVPAPGSLNSTPFPSKGSSI
jgi:hypothetical protein